MTRRNFLKHSIGGGVLLSLSAPAVAQTSQTFRLLTTDEAAAATLADMIGAATGGAMTVDTTLVAMADASGMLDRVSAGEADMCLTGLDSFLPTNMAYGLFASMPFGMSTSELEGWIFASDGADMLAMLGEENGVSFRFAGDSGTKPMWSKAPLTDLAGLQGATVGATGLAITNLTAIGVQNVVDLHDPATDLAGLDVIDGMTAVAMADAAVADAFPHVITANPNTPSGVLSLVIADGVRDAMSDGQLALVERACSAALAHGRAKHFHDDATAMAARGDAVTVSDMPGDIWSALSDGAQGVLTTIFEEGNVQASTVDAYVYFLTDIAGWSRIGEAAFYTGRKQLAGL
jgi:TRAP-type mannitol/chloroaromatic compound transport system substrate-binding protein